MSSRLSRRRLLASGVAAATFGPFLSPNSGVLTPIVSAAPAAGAADLPRTTGRFVVIFLRGGFDGLSAVAPVGDRDYAEARPAIGLKASEAIQLDATFGLHPALAPLHELYQQGELAAVHALSNGTDSRSHFQAQALVELGGQGLAGDGWITRHLATTTPATPGPVRAVALSATTPTSLRACPDCAAMTTTSAFALGGRSRILAKQSDALTALYAGTDAVAAQGKVALTALSEFAKLKASAAGAAANADGGSAVTSTAGTGAGGRPSYLTNALADAGRLLASGLGVEVIAIDASGWDTHQDMGTTSAGRMKDLLSDLGTSLHTFWSDLRHANVKDVTLIALSEFGRRVAQNGSGGLDHGHGNVMFVLAEGIKGGRVVADWPGLAPEKLDRGDLAGTTDYRDVLAELLRRGGNPAVDKVFPGRPGKAVGLV